VKQLLAADLRFYIDIGAKPLVSFPVLRPSAFKPAVRIDNPQRRTTASDNRAYRLRINDIFVYDLFGEHA